MKGVGFLLGLVMYRVKMPEKEVRVMATKKPCQRSPETQPGRPWATSIINNLTHHFSIIKYSG